MTREEILKVIQALPDELLESIWKLIKYDLVKVDSQNTKNDHVYSEHQAIKELPIFSIKKEHPLPRNDCEKQNSVPTIAPTIKIIPCPECGHRIPENASACQNCGCPMVRTNPCPECGQPVPENASACQNCGCPIDAPMVSTQPKTTRTSQSQAAPKQPLLTKDLLSKGKKVFKIAKFAANLLTDSDDSDGLDDDSDDLDDDSDDLDE